MKLIKYIAVLLIFLYACNEGLAPPEPIIPATISGKITYKEGIPWPAQDSVKDIRVVAFKVFPPSNIVADITNGNAYFTNSLPLFVDSCTYTLTLPAPPVEIKYIVVAQQYGSLLEWRAIGVWTLSGDVNQPSALNVNPGNIINDISISVDFSNLPPQPFEK